MKWANINKRNQRVTLAILCSVLYLCLLWISIVLLLRVPNEISFTMPANGSRIMQDFPAPIDSVLIGQNGHYLLDAVTTGDLKSQSQLARILIAKEKNLQSLYFLLAYSNENQNSSIFTNKLYWLETGSKRNYRILYLGPLNETFTMDQIKNLILQIKEDFRIKNLLIEMPVVHQNRVNMIFERSVLLKSEN